MCRPIDVSDLWAMMESKVLRDEARTEVRNRIAEYYYTDCLRLAGKMWTRNRLPPRMREEWESESLTLMLYAAIPKFNRDGGAKFPTFLYFCLKRRLCQMLRTRYNRDTKRMVEIGENTAKVMPVDTVLTSELYQRLVTLVGERVAHGRIFEGWTLQKMADELGVCRATVYNWLQELRGKL